MELADTIKLIIQDNVCPAHDIHPIVEIMGNEIKVLCCCADFHEQCIEEIKGLYMHNRYFPYSLIA